MAATLWILTAGWAGIIYYVSSLPASSVQSTIPDFIPHFIEYVILAVLLAAAIGVSKKDWAAGRVAAWTAGVGALYALTDELHQSFVPGRTPDVKDWAVDVLAVLLVTVSYKLLRRYS